MHTSITVGLTTCQWQALEYIAEDPKDWFISWGQGRADAAARDIVRLYTDTKVVAGQPITAVGTTAIVQAAYDEGIVTTVADANQVGFKT
tara:strand:+ start:1305 stop:1574 length:270 start_codon:yes stop_codon:yes gene_type:complete